MPGNNDRSEKWAGGFVRIVGDGPSRQRVYVIRKMVGGHRYEVSTRQTTEAEALLELVKFQKSPATYDATPEPDLLGDEGPTPVYLDAQMVNDYLGHCDKVGISRVWWVSKKRFLGWWLEKLHGIDLRNADLKQHILKPLEGASSRQHRIAVIKHLYAWLRDAENGRGVLSTSEDPTLSALKVPQRAPAQQTKRRAFSMDDLAKVKEALAKSPSWQRDAIEVLSGTGWHYSELRRFAEAGRVEALPASQRAPVAPPAKAKKARSGRRPAKAKIGHKSPQTTKRFYATLAVPPKIPTLA